MAKKGSFNLHGVQLPNAYLRLADGEIRGGKSGWVGTVHVIANADSLSALAQAESNHAAATDAHSHAAADPAVTEKFRQALEAQSNAQEVTRKAGTAMMVDSNAATQAAFEKAKEAEHAADAVVESTKADEYNSHMANHATTKKAAEATQAALDLAVWNATPHDTKLTVRAAYVEGKTAHELLYAALSAHPLAAGLADH